MKLNSHIKHLTIDAGLFVGFWLAFWLDLTGLTLHQWLGVALAAAAVYHLLLHQKWVEAVSERFFGRTSAQARRYYILDVLLMAGFSLITITGLLISSWLNLALADFGLLRLLHVWSSILTAGLVVVKIALHSGWINQALHRNFGRERAGAAGGVSAGAAPRGTPRLLNAERRAFLKLVGVTGVATLIAVSRALPGAVEALAGDEAQASAASSQTVSLGSAQSSAFSSGCVVRCDRGCSYPGHCRRYTDSNQNGRCDLGECV